MTRLRDALRITWVMGRQGNEAKQKAAWRQERRWATGIERVGPKRSGATGDIEPSQARGQHPWGTGFREAKSDLAKVQLG